jgi:uncharacterized membrane protein
MPERVPILNRKSATLLVALLAVAAFCAVLFSGMLPAPKSASGFTEMYLLGSDNTMHNYPENVTSGGETQVHVVITNHEKTDMNYTLYAEYGNDVQSVPFYRERIPLADSQTAERNVTVRPAIEAGQLRIDFLLYKDEALDAPYLTCRLWLNVTSSTRAA